MRAAWIFTLCVCGLNTALAQQAPPQAPSLLPDNGKEIPAAQAPRGTAIMQKAYALTKSAQHSGDYTAIINTCQQALSQGVRPEEVEYADKLMAWAHNRRGEMHADAKRTAEAMSDFSTALAMDPKLWRAYHNRGVLLATMGTFDEALNDFNRALDIHKDYANTWYNRGEIKYQQGHFEAAIADYNEALKRAPNDGSIYSSRGHALMRLGKTQAAGKDFNTAVEVAPQNVSALIYRGDFVANMGDFAQAARDYRQAIRLNPRQGRAYQSVAWLMATCPDDKIRNPQMAVEAANQAIALDGKNARYLDTLAAALAASGKFDDALKHQQQALNTINDGDPAPLEERMKLYADHQPYVMPKPTQTATVPGTTRR